QMEPPRSVWADRRGPSERARRQNGGGSTSRSWSQFTWQPVYRASQGSVGPERSHWRASDLPAVLLPPARLADTFAGLGPFVPFDPIAPDAPFAPDTALLRRRARSANSAT